MTTPATALLTLLALLTLSTPAWAQNTSATSQQPKATTEAKTTAEEDSTRVVILGYHDFSSQKEATEMLITTDSFRMQMQALKNLQLNVISMEDFIAWKKGEKEIPDKSIVITIDDGWKSVYTEAYPVLKEFGYPFTVFLYTNYIDGGGAALTTAMIKEMQKNGCTIGSHSISHPFPSKVKKEKAKGPESFTKYLQHELGDSRKKLKAKFGTLVNSYAYPGGFVTDEMLPVAKENGYDCMFTVLPGKTRRSSPDLLLPRYIILGTHDNIFRDATTFKATANSAASDGAIIQTNMQPVSPQPGETIDNRLPLITVDLSKVANIDPENILMSIPGYGRVPASYNTDTKTLSWQVNRRLRSPSCEVSVKWKTTDGSKYKRPMTWVFNIDLESSYQSAPLK